MRRLFSLSPFVPALYLGACAHGVSERALTDLQGKLTEAQRKEAEGRRRIDELENRVFLLTDQLESQRVAQQSGRAPRLPVVTLRPAEEESAPRELPPSSSASTEETRPGGEDIEFVGAARSTDARHVRPMLRGDGEGSPPAPEPRSRLARSTPTPSVRLASQSTGAPDSLGTAPAPPIPKLATSSSEKQARTIEKIAPVEHAPLDQEPLTAYRAAYGELAAGRYEEAERALRAFVKRYPRHDYADNAQYWLGETYYARRQFQEAAVEFRAAVAKYPVGNKAPDALLKLAYSLLATGDQAEARRILGELPATYPRSDASRLATQKLAELSPSHKPEMLEAPR